MDKVCVKRGGFAMKRWRSKSNKSLFARPIYKDEFPLLIKAMREDGLCGKITSKGIDWSVHGYSLTNKSVREAWNLSDSQYRRLCDWIYTNDSFSTEYRFIG